MTLQERWDAQAAQTRLAAAGKALFELRRGLQAELTTAKQWTNPEITQQSIQSLPPLLAQMEIRVKNDSETKRRGELAQAVRDRFAPQLAQLQAQVKSDSETIEAFAAKERPTMGADAVALQKATMAWDGVKVRLDAGMNVREILAGADRDTVLAVAEWAPAWLEAKHYSGSKRGLADGPYEPPNLDGLHRSIDDRLAQVVSGDEALSLTLARDAKVAVAGFQPLADHTAALTRNEAHAQTSGMEAALNAHFATQEAAHGSAVEGAEATESGAA